MRPNRFILSFLLILTSLLAPGRAPAQTTATLEPETATAYAFPLTIQSIMRGPELVGEEPTGVSWTDDSRWVYFRWRPGGGAWDDSRDLYRVPAGGGEPEKLTEEEADSLAIFFAGGDVSPDGRYRVSSVNGDLFLVNRRNMTVTQLTDTRDIEGAPSFRRDGEAVFFRRGDNLYELTLDDAGLRQLTDIREGSPPREAAEAEGQRGFLEEQQKALFEHIRRQEAQEEKREARQEKTREGEPKPLYLSREERLGGLTPNADGSYVMITTFSPPQGAQSTMVPEWVTESGYTEEQNSRTKVGDVQATSRIGLLEVASGTVTWLDLYPTDDGAGEGEEGGGDRVESKHPDLSSAGFLGWNDAGTLGLLTSTNYEFDTRWYFTVEAATGDVTVVDTWYDEAWAEGACSRGCAGWIPASNRVYFSSEESGYAHLYSVEADGAGRQALTSGPWEVQEVEVLRDQESFLLHTNESSPFNHQAFTMAFDGSGKRALTPGDGSFEVTPSPNGRRMAVVHSVANRPPELFLGDFKAEATLAQVTHSPTEEWLSFPWLKPEIIRFTAQDGAQVPARIYRPSELGAQANGAAVIFVHGAGYLQNVHNYWSSYYREYMFHHFLASMGYTVLDIDYRGSSGYGRDWRTAIYRWMGGKDLSDQVDGARYLVEREGIDAARIGIYGGSYGGFITLMALFTAPETFEAGAALRAVTDWAHYNHWYTGRILNLPQDDPEAYEKSSPIYFAEGLKGHLLIAHGMVDTNVHFSDVVRLAQRLIELGKENWEMAVYPVESHGFVEPTSWTDEYRRIFELFDSTIGKK
jgi:acetyl esterase/lipase